MHYIDHVPVAVATITVVINNFNIIVNWSTRHYHNHLEGSGWHTFAIIIKINSKHTFALSFLNEPINLKAVRSPTLYFRKRTMTTNSMTITSGPDYTFRNKKNLFIIPQWISIISSNLMYVDTHVSALHLTDRIQNIAKLLINRKQRHTQRGISFQTNSKQP